MVPVPTLDLSRIDAAIFDLDGVVTKTARVHAQAWKRLFDEFLQERSRTTKEPFRPFDLIKDYRPYVDGKPRHDGVASFLASRGITLPFGQRDDPPERRTICGLANRKNLLFLQALEKHGVETFPSTRLLIEELKVRGKTVAVVTASRNCSAVLHAAGLSAIFDVRVDGHDADRDHLKGKPAPDMFLQAAALMNTLPARTAVFEDAQAGIQAGRAGNFGLVIGVDRVGQKSEFLALGADVVVDDLEQLALDDGERRLCRQTSTLGSALDCRSAIFQRLPTRSAAIFLDYDGTLTPIVDRPEWAILSDAMRDTLSKLSRHCPVGIISGRDREVIRELVGLESLVYAGSHGFDIGGPQGQEFLHQEGKSFLPTLDEAETLLRTSLASIKGAIVERKKFSIAVHYRLVAPSDLPAVAAAVKEVLARHRDLRKINGKKIYDLQPDLEWDKGRAVVWLLQTLRIAPERMTPFFIGDDVTDEAAFRALQDTGIGIVVVESPRYTYATYRLRDVEEVRGFLDALGQYLQEPSA